MKRKILIAEDEGISRRLLCKMLENWNYEVIQVENGTAALAELQKPSAPKIAILDWMMPGMNGTEVIQEVRKLAGVPYTYTLLLTAKNDKTDVLAGLECGADDYLTKPFDPQELRARVRAGERIIHLHEQLERAIATSEFRASHDPLTGLYNRRTIVSLLEREAARCVREGTELSVILVDIDRFKSINDTYGHAAGDQVLLETAGRMQSALRAHDFLGRYGGEEFLVVLPSCGLKDSQEVAERLRESVARSPISVDDITVKVTASFGATSAGFAENTGAMLQRADVALYEAKNGGRNMVKFRPAPEIESVPGHLLRKMAPGAHDPNGRIQ